MNKEVEKLSTSYIIYNYLNYICFFSILLCLRFIVFGSLKVITVNNSNDNIFFKRL